MARMRVRLKLPRLPDLGAAFGWLLLSDALTTLAMMVGQVALPWWIATAGGAHALAAYSVIVAGVTLLAMPLMAPLGDRHPKRWLLGVALVAFAVAALGFAVLASLHRYHLPTLIALGAVTAFATAVQRPCAASFCTELVPPAGYARAMGLQQSAQALGRMVGPAIGGAVLGVAGIAAALWLHLAMLVGAAASTRALPTGAPPGTARRAWRDDLLTGVRLNFSIPLERGWLLVNFVSWIFLGPTFAMLVPLKVQSLGLSGTWLGLAEAGLSLGMLAGSLGGAEAMVTRFGRFNVRVGAAVVQGLAIALAGATHSGPWLVAGFAVAGLMNAAMVMVGMGHRMLARPLAFRARMVAGAITTTHVAAMIGPALAGVALLHASIATVFVTFGVVGAAAALGLAAVPGFKAFMALDHEAVDGFYQRTWPEAFRE